MSHIKNEANWISVLWGLASKHAQVLEVKSNPL